MKGNVFGLVFVGIFMAGKYFAEMKFLIE